MIIGYVHTKFQIDKKNYDFWLNNCFGTLIWWFMTYMYVIRIERVNKVRIEFFCSQILLLEFAEYEKTVFKITKISIRGR